MRGFLAFGAVVALAATLAPRPHQLSGCQLEVRTQPGVNSRLLMLEEGGTRLDAGGGVEAICGNRSVKSDSATYFDARGQLYLFGNVLYEDGRRTLEADSAVYFEAEERVRADGHVVLTDPAQGSKLTGPIVHYYPQTESRPFERIFAPGRPHLTFVSAEAGASDTTPFEVDADHIHIHGDSVVGAFGEVIAVRGELTAFADSMELDGASDEFQLLGEPSMQTTDMLLEGDTIVVFLDQNSVREIRAWPNGSARSREMSLTAPSLRFFVEADQIERAIASPGDSARGGGAVERATDEPWARSESQDYTLVADSIEILRPGGQLEQLTAVGRARAASTTPVAAADSAFGNDWLVGDTISGYFAAPNAGIVDTAGASDAPGQPGAQLERLVASGSARALYHLTQEAGGNAARPGINYVIGRIVTLWLADGEVQEAQVIGPSTGVYLEPLPLATDGDSLVVVAGDSVLPIPIDSVAVADTTSAPPDTLESAPEDPRGR